MTESEIQVIKDTLLAQGTPKQLVEETVKSLQEKAEKERAERELEAARIASNNLKSVVTLVGLLAEAETEYWRQRNSPLNKMKRFFGF